MSPNPHGPRSEATESRQEMKASIARFCPKERGPVAQFVGAPCSACGDAMGHELCELCEGSKACGACGGEGRVRAGETQVAMLVYAREQLEFAEGRYLRSRGWTNHSSTPGSFWVWEREHEGRTLMADRKLAVWFQEDIDADEAWARRGHDKEAPDAA